MSTHRVTRPPGDIHVCPLFPKVVNLLDTTLYRELVAVIGDDEQGEDDDG